MSEENHCYVCDGINDEIRESLCFKLCKPCYDSVLISSVDVTHKYGITDIQMRLHKEWENVPHIPSSHGQTLYVHDDVKKIVLAKRGSLDWYAKRESKKVVLNNKRHDAIKKNVESAGLYFSPTHHLIAKYIASGKPSIKSVIRQMSDEKYESDKSMERYKILHERLQKEGLPTNRITDATEYFIENANDDELETKLEEAVNDVRTESKMTESQLKEKKYLDDLPDEYYDRYDRYDGCDATAFVDETVDDSKYYFAKEESCTKE